MNDKPLNQLDIGSDEEQFGSFINPEMDSVFQQTFSLEMEEAVTLNKNYILHISGVSLGSENKVALGMSSGESCVYSVASSLNSINTLPAESDPIINIRFAPDNPSLLYIGSSKGSVTLWDLRDTNRFAHRYKDTSEPSKNNLHEKNFCSFDVNSTGRFLCAGTEVTDGDAYLLFWDTRQNSLLGGYWDCHTDDVTQVVFHPSEADQLITGSTDGLINLFDVSQTDENEALIQSFNTESSVEKLAWHDVDFSCITHTADVQLWRTEDSGPSHTFSRKNMATDLQITSDELANSLYIAGVHSTSDAGRLLFLAGSNIASGRCLRSGLSSGGKLIPHSYFDGNKQIVRCSWFDSQKELLMTGGEAGILSIWKPGNSQNAHSPNQLKARSKLKGNTQKKKIKPY